MFVLFCIGISLLTVAVIYKIVKIIYEGITYRDIDCDEMAWFFVGCAILGGFLIFLGFMIHFITRCL